LVLIAPLVNLGRLKQKASPNTNAMFATRLKRT